MLRRLNKEDLKLISNLFLETNKYDERKITNLRDTMDDTKILCGNVEQDKITSLLVTNLIKNNYYLEEVIFTTPNLEEIKDLITFTIKTIREDERGLNIIYDNVPYSEIMHQTMISNGFKCNYMNLLYNADNQVMDLINSRVLINDKSLDVKKYIYENYCNEIKTNNAYLGIKTELPNIDSIRLENTNVAVIRDKNKKVIGTARFGLISDSIYLYSLYANDKETYKDLVVLIKNLTDRKIEVGFFPSRTDLIETLLDLGFKKMQTDYTLKLN